jgi:hypothetical protein
MLLDLTIGPLRRLLHPLVVGEVVGHPETTTLGCRLPQQNFSTTRHGAKIPREIRESTPRQPRYHRAFCYLECTLRAGDLKDVEFPQGEIPVRRPLVSHPAELRDHEPSPDSRDQF